MMRHSDRFLPLLVAAALFAAVPTASAIEAPAKRGEVIAALKTQAQAAGRVRVVVELRVGPSASRRVLNGIQRDVVTRAFGVEAWRLRGTGTEVHAIPEMSAAHHFAASVTATEIDSLATHPRVRRVAAEAGWTPSPRRTPPPAK